jgi:hypothetical protein
MSAHFMGNSFLRMASLLLTVASSAATLYAQDPKPLTIGGFLTQGSVTAGYRFANIKGRREEYQTLFNLRDGLRLMDLNVYGRSESKGTRFADDYSLTLGGLGGDPFPGGQLSVRKNGLYDLRVSYRQSYYVWDRDDNAALPSGFRGLTTNHDWSTVRKFGSANFNIKATNALRFGAEFYRGTRDGLSFTTRAIDYFNAPAAWGNFARANPYYVEAPINEEANRFTGSVDYTRDRWNAYYKVGYQSFNSTTNGANLTSPQRSINVDEAATASELARLISWSDTRNLKAPVSEFSYNGAVNSQVDLRGGYMFYRYRGPASLHAAYLGNARSNPTGLYSLAVDTNSEVTEPTHIVDQGVTMGIRPWWNLLFDYRYTHSGTEGRGDFEVVADTVPSAGVVEYNWSLRTHIAELNFEFLPASTLTIRTGLRYWHRNVEESEVGVPEAYSTAVINTVVPSLNVYYRPSSRVTLRADFSSITDGTSYTRISPRTDVRSRISARLQPTGKMWVETALILRNRSYDVSGFRNNMRISSTNLTYQAYERLTVFAGISYDSYFATSDVTFLRGTPPLDVVWRDQSISRTWSGGFSAQPASRFGISFSGNFVRTTGRGEISGELPNYGPMTFPYATATLSYDFPNAGKLSLDVQRTYYIEEIVPENNFSGSLLTIRWTKDF